MTRIRFRLGAGLLLVSAAWPQSIRFAELCLPRHPFDFPQSSEAEVSAFPDLNPKLRYEANISGAYAGWADFRGPDSRFEISRASAQSEAWVALGPHRFGIAAANPGSDMRIRRDSSLNASLAENSPRLGFAFLLSPESSPWQALVSAPDPRRFGYGFGLRRHAASGITGELFYATTDHVEKAEATAADDTSLVRIAGWVSGRVQSVRARLGIPLWAGTASGSAEWGWAAPRWPATGTYWLSDSSLSLRLGAAYRRDVGVVSLGGFYDFFEAQEISIGRVINEVSGGTKRFHTARIHPLWMDGGLQASLRRPGMLDSVGLQAGGTYATLLSHPPRDALSLREETLSYNRLGLSLFAAVFGGLARQSEWVDVTAELRQAHARAGLGAAQGPFRLGLGALFTVSDFSVRAHRRLVSTTFGIPSTDAEDRWEVSGWMLSARPELVLRCASRSLSLEISGAQWLPLFGDVGSGSPGGGASPGTGGKTETPWFGNGFEAAMRFRVGF